MTEETKTPLGASLRGGVKRLCAAVRRLRGRADAAVPPREGLRLTLTGFAALAGGCVIALLTQLVTLGSAAAVEAWVRSAAGAFDLTALLYGGVSFVLACLTARFYLAFFLTGAAGLVFALANFIKVVINGSPIGIEDFKLVSTLGEVTGVAGALPVPGTFWVSAALLIVLTLGLALVSPALRALPRGRFLGFSVALALLYIGCFDSGDAALARRFGVDIEKRQTAELSYAEYGITVGLWRDYRAGSAFDITQYSPEYMDWILQEIDSLLAETPTDDAEGTETAAAAQEPPNVVLILDEAMFDISQLPGVTYSADPFANFHRYESESLTGSFFSGYLGYGTGYVEMGVLSGLNARFFELGTNVCFLKEENYQKLPAVPAQFQSLGYHTASYHTHNNSLYNRAATFPAMGFDESWYIDDMPGYTAHGAYAADEYLMGLLTERFEEETSAGNKVFLYGITMENHQPYVAGKFTEKSGVTASAEGLSDDAAQVLQCLTDGAVYADRAVGTLLDYFQSQSEPVLVVIFGDHRPNLSVTETENLYTDLGLNETSDVTQWTTEQLKTLYTTDYLAWSNVPALAQTLAGSTAESSYQTLGAKLLSLAGIPMSRYWALVERFSQVSLVDSDLYFARGDGTVFRSEAEAGLTEDEQAVLSLLQAVYYDAFYGEQYITAELALPAEGK